MLYTCKCDRLDYTGGHYSKNVTCYVQCISYTETRNDGTVYYSSAQGENPYFGT